MEIFDQFFTLPTLLFCLIIYIIAWLIRSLLELEFPKLKIIKLWTDILLPTIPLLIGGILAVILHSYAFPALFISSASKFIFGVCCGLFSSYVYRLAKQFVVSKVGDSSSLPLPEPQATQQLPLKSSETPENKGK